MEIRDMEIRESEKRDKKENLSTIGLKIAESDYIIQRPWEGEIV